MVLKSQHKHSEIELISEPYIDRDIDWLAFNARVLQEASDSNNPIYERLKFLAIFSSNLDEFFKVRVSKIRQIGKVKKSIRKPLALRPNKLSKQILKEVNKLQDDFGKIYRESILPELKQNGIEIIELAHCEAVQREIACNFFTEKILPEITVVNSEQSNIKSLVDSGLYLLVAFSENNNLVFLSVPSKRLGRFIDLGNNQNSHQYLFIEDIIKEFCQDLFDEKVQSIHSIKISRDAELYLEDDYDGEWIKQIYEALKKRQEGQPTRFLFEKGMSAELQKRARKLFNLGKVDMIEGGNRHNFSDFFSFPMPLGKEELQFEPLPPIRDKHFDSTSDIFQLIKEKDRILHFPYHSFGHLEDWLEQAASDKNVTSINISLYRIAKDSSLSHALIKALENNIKVTVFVEASARFDEENNLFWGKSFEEHGAKVFYSFQNLKVHSKILLIQREEKGKKQNYAYIGTGNFNAKTSKIYCDHGLFTAQKEITNDLKQVFKVLKREILVPKVKTLIVSPFNSRTTFEQLIQNEIDNATKGLPSGITIKMNSLEDKQMIDYLYRANNAGVKIRLLIRGFCCLRPGLKGLSENIIVTSIVDRFLEHGRIYLFKNNKDEKMFIGSADWMTRNLDKRIEVLTPIFDTDILNELKYILILQLADNVKARIRDANGGNKYFNSDSENLEIRSQLAIYDFIKYSNLR